MARDAVAEFEAGATLEMIIEDGPVSYTHLRAHETGLDIVCRLLLEKKKNLKKKKQKKTIIV